MVEFRKYDYFFTVFIPAFNRRKTLPRLLESIENQTFRDFEVIIIDDGSTDRTDSYIREYMKQSDLKITYKWQKNSGKPTARNNAVNLSKGFMFKTVDSDDVLDYQCLQSMFEAWNSLPDNEKNRFAGIIALCADITTHNLIGNSFPKDLFESNQFLNNAIYGIKGDKTQCIKTEIMKSNPFPVIGTNKFVPESIVWNRIGLDYSFLCINRVLAYKEYLKDGLTKNITFLKLKNKESLLQYYYELNFKIISSYKNVPLKFKIRSMANYIRFLKHNKKEAHLHFLKTENSYLLYLLSLPLGTILYLKDINTMRQKNEK